MVFGRGHLLTSLRRDQWSLPPPHPLSWRLFLPPPPPPPYRKSGGSREVAPGHEGPYWLAEDTSDFCYCHQHQLL